MASHDEGKNNSQHPWSELLPELLSMICLGLRPIDVSRFRAVCKHWNSCGFTVCPADLTPILISNTITDSGLIRCYSPYLNKMFIVSTPLRAPESRIFSGDANGWAMLRGPEKTVSLASPLDGSTFDTTESEFYGGYFCSSREDVTGVPELRGVVGMYALKYGVKFQSWGGESSKYFQGQRSEFAMLYCKPVLHKGLWYCIGERGRLGVFDPMKSEWSVLEEPNGFGTELKYKNCYLVESRGELLVVLTGVNGTPLNVLRLNEEEMAWERVESLGSRAIFTGTLSSQSMDKPPGAMANKVYLPKFYGCPQVIQAELTNSVGRLGFVPQREVAAGFRWWSRLAGLGLLGSRASDGRRSQRRRRSVAAAGPAVVVVLLSVRSSSWLSTSRTT
ncbi:hypothetical protein SEVIR_6G061700v4 [Setaria viridis]|uniref:KIB1-4 beta-propeller domain-containing protein n=1 Tax=Setaria viridis TaxID=4556 RepID=A0A4U6U3V5_SETVI|nr:F-box/kelch-repeat protein At1g57790-like [Setaria viridis]TKW08985.1 hypothetical protein SEVIR_6G061700v2 [Setaria viridis]TKW08986.1 hypothetical protein SEVIR_6G061700v2 [Setaria viridis]